MRNRIKKTIVVSATVLLFGCAYAFLYSKTGFGIPCLFHLLTGYNCPGCGVTRMLISLFSLDFPAAFSYNACLFAITPVLLYLFVKGTYSYIHHGSFKGNKFDTILTYGCVGLLLAWGVVRNALHV